MSEKNGAKQKCCMDCAYFRAMIYADDKTDAFYGKCTSTMPTERKMRGGRSSFYPACERFMEAKNGPKTEK